MYISLYVKYTLCLPFFNETFSREVFEKSLNIKFHGNPSSGSLVVSCGLTDMTQLIVTFCNSGNGPKISTFCP